MTWRAGSGVQRGLLLRRGEGPRRARAALLAEDEAQLLWRAQLCLARTEGGTRLVELERAEQVDAEVALLAADETSLLGTSRRLPAVRQSNPPKTWIERTRAIKARAGGPLKGARAAHAANRRENAARLVNTRQAVTLM
jgi:hypothetical protein